MVRVKTLASAFVLIILVGWLGYCGYSHKVDFAELTVVGPWLLACMAKEINSIKMILRGI